MITCCAFLVVALLGQAEPRPEARAEDSYADTLIARAAALELASHPMWRTLLHYRPRFPSGYVSEADSPGFFLARNGRTDPAAELEATLRAFFAPEDVKIHDQHPQCAFIARYRWLKEMLAFDPARLPERDCPRFEAWYTGINPGSVTLVFPSAYLNSPASMYGHTLLRIDPPDQPDETRLASYAINFAALTPDRSGLAFAFKGLTGLYPGGFSVLPYYEKVRTYSDIESRDIWEYQLTLNRDEVERLLLHAWELGHVTFDYYFFDENCSYQLLTLLDAARPGLDLAGQFFYHVIPIDTVRVTLAVPGMLARTAYRPSLSTRMKHRLQYMSEQEESLAHAVATGARPIDDVGRSGLSPAAQARVLDMAFEYLQYLAYHEQPERDSYARRSLDILRARSRVEADDGVPDVPVPSVAPHEGHKTARLDLTAGTLDGKAYGELRLRAAYHDLLDPPGGYTEGARLEMFALTARRAEDDADELDLEALDFVNIASIAPRDRFFRPKSWKLAFGIRREWVATGTRLRTGVVDGGIGLSWSTGVNSYVYGLVESSLLLHGDFPHDHALALGPSLGLVWQPLPRWRAMLTARAQHYVSGLDFTAAEYAVEQNFDIGREHGLRLRLAREGSAGEAVTSIRLSLLTYF
ncbi:MAG TPA: DUF4105 domain-containing protein [Gammaproteobacteria bacterium]|nr:DUF4105 domain-containing protein [Gammaproteobacteria bacterium]